MDNWKDFSRTNESAKVLGNQELKFWQKVPANLVKVNIVKIQNGFEIERESVSVPSCRGRSRKFIFRNFSFNSIQRWKRAYTSSVTLRFRVFRFLQCFNVRNLRNCSNNHQIKAGSCFRGSRLHHIPCRCNRVNVQRRERSTLVFLERGARTRSSLLQILHDSMSDVVRRFVYLLDAPQVHHLLDPIWAQRRPQYRLIWNGRRKRRREAISIGFLPRSDLHTSYQLLQRKVRQNSFLFHLNFISCSHPTNQLNKYMDFTSHEIKVCEHRFISIHSFFSIVRSRSRVRDTINAEECYESLLGRKWLAAMHSRLPGELAMCWSIIRLKESILKVRVLEQAWSVMCQESAVWAEMCWQVQLSRRSCHSCSVSLQWVVSVESTSRRLESKTQSWTLEWVPSKHLSLADLDFADATACESQSLD